MFLKKSPLSKTCYRSFIFFAFLAGAISFNCNKDKVTEPDPEPETGVIPVGEFQTQNEALSIYVEDDYVYLVDGEGLNVIDISNPEEPVSVANPITPGYARSVFVLERCAYIADGDAGLQIYFTANPTNPVLAGNCDSLNIAHKVIVRDDYAYVIDADSGLYIVDATNPYEPSLIAVYEPNERFIDFTIDDNLLYILRRYTFLDVVDISAPAEPVQVSRAFVGDVPRDIVIKDDYAYFAHTTGLPPWNVTLKVLDVINPASPRLAGLFYQGFNSPNKIYIKDDYAYLATRSKGLVIVDISYPPTSFQVGDYMNPEVDYGYEVNDVFVMDEYIYLADSLSGLLIMQFIPEPEE